MAYAFDGRVLGQMLVETERLAEQSRDHEHRLARLALQLEGRSQPQNSDLVLEIKHLCAHTRDQREQLEAMLVRLVGSPPEERGGPGTSMARVLVADDSAENRERAARALEASGFLALTAADGLEALMLAHFAKPDVVVVGVSMPVLDGIETARLLKASPSTRHVRVVAYTAWPSFYDGPLKSVFDGVLAKPSTSESLVASVRQFLAVDPPLPAATG
jgi:CheY-like chemotaxis protein